jgi:hypothetical protein
VNTDSSVRSGGRARILVLVLALVLGALTAMMASLFLMTTDPAKAAQQKQGGPLILMDIDAEDGGPEAAPPPWKY